MRRVVRRRNQPKHPANFYFVVLTDVVLRDMRIYYIINGPISKYSGLYRTTYATNF